jgi:hypothetical protein
MTAVQRECLILTSLTRIHFHSENNTHNSPVESQEGPKQTFCDSYISAAHFSQQEKSQQKKEQSETFSTGLHVHADCGE